MYRILLVLIALLIQPAQLVAAPLQVFACEPEWALLAEAIGGDRVVTTRAIAADQDPHQVQARPSLISAVRRADLVICTGAGLEEGWLPVLLSRAANPRVQQAPGRLYAADHVTLIEIPQRLDRSDGHLHAAGNPHLHLDPRRLLQVAAIVQQQLSALDPDHAGHYQQRHQQFQHDWQHAMTRWHELAAPLRGQRVVVHHRSFSYLLDWLGMETLAEMEPHPGLPPTPRHLQSILAQLQQHPASLILYAPFNGDQGARWLASRSSACAVMLPFSHDASLFALFDELVSRLTTTLEQCGER